MVISAVPGWRGFEKLIKLIRKKHDVKILEKLDGPDARRWILEKNGRQFELICDDVYGNYLTATSVEGELLVNEIGKDLEQYFDGAEK